MRVLLVGDVGLDVRQAVERRHEVVLAKCHPHDVAEKFYSGSVVILFCTGDPLEPAVVDEIRSGEIDYTPIIIVTRESDLSLAMTAMNFGATSLLVDPGPATVLRAVDRAISLKRIAELSGEAAEAVGKADVEQRVRKAIDSLWLAIQPIEKPDGVIYGYEVLMRTDESTLPTPASVLEAAEDADLADELAYAVRLAARKVVEVVRASRAVFVNVNPVDLLGHGIYLATDPLASVSKRVVLEITERERLAAPKHDIERLRAMGYRIALDDLGSGYAGLDTLVTLEPDIVKLDMGLIRGCDSSPVKRKLIMSMVNVCHDLGITVVAEGIETPAERDAVTGMGCDLLQGYLIGRPFRPEGD